MFERTKGREALYLRTNVAMLLMPLDCHAELETWPSVCISMPCLGRGGLSGWLLECEKHRNTFRV